MSIEKKSLISTLKTTKKANVASAPATNDGSTSRKAKIVKAGMVRKAGAVRKAGMVRKANAKM
ncbi:MAG: hypothetical protein WAM58_02180 [Candidatus Acidiferrum sp.]